jgi:hypothetical protein
VFNGTRKELGRGFIYSVDYTHKISGSNETKGYRFYAMSINPEDVGWDGTREGLSRVGDINIKSRPYDEYNMIIFTIEDIL